MERLTEKGAEYSPAQTLCRAQEKDAALCAHIQRQSWRTAFRGILPEDTLDQLTALAKNEAMYSQVLAAGLIEGWLLFLDDASHAMAFWGPSRDEETQGWAELICIHSLPDNWGLSLIHI